MLNVILGFDCRGSYCCLSKRQTEDRKRKAEEKQHSHKMIRMIDNLPMSSELNESISTILQDESSNSNTVSSLTTSISDKNEIIATVEIEIEYVKDKNKQLEDRNKNLDDRNKNLETVIANNAITNASKDAQLDLMAQQIRQLQSQLQLPLANKQPPPPQGPPPLAATI